jgi:DNA polymerase-3 subunit delta
MKLTWREIDGFVQKPDPRARVVLVYGPDDGLMRERARTIARTIVKDLNDPFNAATLTSDIVTSDPARLNDEAFAISMMGGGRLVRVENATDKITAAVKFYLENPNPDCLVVLEAGELTTKSSLRILCEKSPKAAAIPCYVDDEQALSRLIRESAKGANLTIAPDAVAWLSAAIGGDRAKARGEIEKLITYKGTDKTQITLEDVHACCGDNAASNLDALIFAAAGRKGAEALAIYDRLIGEGVAFITILRTLQNHFRRLHITRARVDAGDNTDAAIKSLAPPVFFKFETAFRAQVNAWSLPTLEKIMARLMDLEAECKKTGAPAETLCAQAVLGVAATRG